VNFRKHETTNAVAFCVVVPLPIGSRWPWLSFNGVPPASMMVGVQLTGRLGIGAWIGARCSL